jgi:cytochrome c553
VKLILGMLVFTMALPVFGQDAAKGAKLFKKCVACHGKKAEGKKSQKAPRLAGQHSWYIVTQLIAFKTKKRKNPPMLPFVRKLTPEQMADLGAYLESIK